MKIHSLVPNLDPVLGMRMRVTCTHEQSYEKMETFGRESRGHGKGYHIYKQQWDAAIGEELQYQPE